MQDISDLLKEAKPLYYARKRRNNIIKSSFVGVACLFLAVFNYPKQQMSNSFCYFDLGLAYETSDETFIESMGLPVDDYGLLLVS